MSCAGPKNVLNETKANTTQQNIKKILIVGSGLVETRFFLDVFTTSFINKLNSRGIEAKYAFLGKDSIAQTKEFNKLETENYDAVITFFPIDSSHNAYVEYNKINSGSNPYLGPPTYPIYTRNISFGEMFKIDLYNPRNKSDIIWSATLQVQCDLRDRDVISNIAQNVISRLKAAKVLK